MSFTHLTQTEMDNLVGSNRCTGAQRASPAIDRQSLEKALAEKDDGRWSNSLELIMKAARKHLETLPKPMWRVTASLPNGDAAAAYIVTSHKEAIDFARGYLEQGLRWVTVTQVSP